MIFLTGAVRRWWVGGQQPYHFNLSRMKKQAPGVLDVHRVMFNLHRKNLPPMALEEKRVEYVKEGLIDKESSKRVLNCILQERGTTTYLNDGVEEVPENAAMGGLSTKLSPAAMKELLAKRERMMQESRSGEGKITDQFRVYSHIIHCIESGQFLRLMVQVFLFCRCFHSPWVGWGLPPDRQMHRTKTLARQALVLENPSCSTQCSCTAW